MDSMTSPEGFRHHLALQVRWGDMDALGHVNNAVYLTYLEQARIDYASGLWSRSPRGVGIGLIMARAVIDYKMSLFSDDDVHIYTRCSRLGNRSFDMEQWVTRLKDDELQVAAQATITVVVYDYDAQQSVPIPEAWREIMQSYEGRAL
jgi:acyl-CoA thioester hydrolase